MEFVVYNKKKFISCQSNNSIPNCIPNVLSVTSYDRSDHFQGILLLNFITSHMRWVVKLCASFFFLGNFPLFAATCAARIFIFPRWTWKQMERQTTTVIYVDNIQFLLVYLTWLWNPDMKFQDFYVTCGRHRHWPWKWNFMEGFERVSGIGSQFQQLLALRSMCNRIAEKIENAFCSIAWYPAQAHAL